MGNCARNDVELQKPLLRSLVWDVSRSLLGEWFHQRGGRWCGDHATVGKRRGKVLVTDGGPLEEAVRLDLIY